MIKKYLFLMFAAIIFTAMLGISPSIALTIGGVTRQPLNLSMEDMAKFESVTIRLNEVTKDNKFRGVFTYRGVALKALLELAYIQKEESGFLKPIDLAVVVRNKDGKTTVLSWGEIFFRNPGDAIIALSAVPIMPYHKSCGDCHGPNIYEPALNQLKRKVGLPKLVLANDFFTDRSLEDIVHIDIIEMKQKTEKKQLNNFNSPKFNIINVNGKTFEFKDLSGYSRIKVDTKNVGDGRGYHGWKRFGGISLREVLKKLDMEHDADTAILVTSVDGYRVLISYGELFLAPGGERIMVADTVADTPIKENGKFALVFPDDTAADRMVKALSKIEIVSLKEKPKIFIIGMGCADTSLITLEAISYMGKADVFIAPDDISKRFGKYMGEKPVLFDPLKNTAYMFKKSNPNLSDAQIKEKLETQRSNDMQKVRDALSVGKSVALLEYGDPTIYPAWQHWFGEIFKDQIEIIPGISAFNAANAFINEDLSCKGGSLILTMTNALMVNEGMLKAVASGGDTLAIFVGLRELKTLAPLLQKHYSPMTPVQIAYKVGYSNGRHLTKTTVGDIVAAAEKNKEKHLGMIYVGPCLK